MSAWTLAVFSRTHESNLWAWALQDRNLFHQFCPLRQSVYLFHFGIVHCILKTCCSSNLSHMEIFSRSATSCPSDTRKDARELLHILCLCTMSFGLPWTSKSWTGYMYKFAPHILLLHGWVAYYLERTSSSVYTICWSTWWASFQPTQMLSCHLVGPAALYWFCQPCKTGPFFENQVW